MSTLLPRVTVGIPTFNREQLIGRAVQSVLNQDYPNIEIVISDNASTDSTSAICLALASANSNIVYFRHLENIGATRNFAAVLKRASGHYFMWLGDDDYIDPTYVAKAVAMLERDATVELVSGEAKYYRGGALVATGRRFNVLSIVSWRRIASYYWRVRDNGLFYGLMKTSTIAQVPLRNVLGGDWIAMARIAAVGKIVMLPETAVHRELGGASHSYANIARALGISSIHARFPYASIAWNASHDLASVGFPISGYSDTRMRVTAVFVFFVLLTKALATHLMRGGVLLRDSLKHFRRAN